ncbi:hypothetical protein PoB_000937600 [Plakobranchus ocellatus]|uniref:Uncharacterized protein n=1 Tax=Plakobranchus ocellatus TaxID=259542 RepID=A0AAV3YKG4_9GAST|nr:hypothetical protein PoB_000937600 [Plakobranchus ocellatus]
MSLDGRRFSYFKKFFYALAAQSSTIRCATVVSQYAVGVLAKRRNRSKIVAVLARCRSSSSRLPPTNIHSVQTTPQTVRIAGLNCQSDLALPWPRGKPPSTRAHSCNRDPVEDSRIALLNLSITRLLHAGWVINELSGARAPDELTPTVAGGNKPRPLCALHVKTWNE